MTLKMYFARRPDKLLSLSLVRREEIRVSHENKDKQRPNNTWANSRRPDSGVRKWAENFVFQAKACSCSMRCDVCRFLVEHNNESAATGLSSHFTTKLGWWKNTKHAACRSLSTVYKRRSIERLNEHAHSVTTAPHTQTVHGIVSTFVIVWLLQCIPFSVPAQQRPRQSILRCYVASYIKSQNIYENVHRTWINVWLFGCDKGKHQRLKIRLWIKSKLAHSYTRFQWTLLELHVLAKWKKRQSILVRCQQYFHRFQLGVCATIEG